MVALTHLARQEKALREFLSAHATDEHAFEARLRLARLLQIRAGLENNEALRTEARRLLEQLAQTATPEQRVEVDFALITFQMRALRTPSPREKEELLLVTRRFQAEHPDDRRLPRLLVEVANVFDAEPETKRALLQGAQAIAKEESLKARIADDLRRLDFIGKPLLLRLATIVGKAVSVEESRGKVVLLLFFADWSPPSIEAIAKVQAAVREIPKERLQLLGVSLDNKPDNVAGVINKSGIAWPVGYDGKGWASPVVRTMGINALPAVWLIDQRGIVRSVNALDGTADQVWALIRKPPPAE